MYLNVSIKARFDHELPPKDIEEQVSRTQADAMANRVASNLEQIVKLIIIELLSAEIGERVKA